MEPGQARQIGFRLRKGNQAETLVAFDAVRKQVFIDRTRSGEVSFSKDYPGIHAARLENSPTVSLRMGWT